MVVAVCKQLYSEGGKKSSRKIAEVTDLYILNEKKKLYWKFNPSNLDDFSKKTTYGRIQKIGDVQWMYKYYIVLLAGMQYLILPHM